MSEHICMRAYMHVCVHACTQILCVFMHMYVFVKSDKILLKQQFRSGRLSTF